MTSLRPRYWAFLEPQNLLLGHLLAVIYSPKVIPILTSVIDALSAAEFSDMFTFEFGCQCCVGHSWFLFPWYWLAFHCMNVLQCWSILKSRFLAWSGLGYHKWSTESIHTCVGLCKDACILFFQVCIKKIKPLVTGHVLFSLSWYCLTVC